MSENTKNHRKFNVLALNKIAKQYGCSERYVRACVNGERCGTKQDAIRNDYKVMDKAIKEAIERL